MCASAWPHRGKPAGWQVTCEQQTPASKRHLDGVHVVVMIFRSNARDSWDVSTIRHCTGVAMPSWSLQSDAKATAVAHMLRQM
jgi:hypothetical protein